MITVDDVQGHWQRAWLKAPGVVDHDTCVHWMQHGSLYADIRIPADRPDIRGARALDELSPACLAELMKAEGFAGEITVADDVCTWERAINWHGAPESVDAGRLVFNDDGSLTEEGVHADYAELWTRIDDLPDEGWRLRSDRGETAFLVTVGPRFAFGVGEPGAASSKPLVEALALGRRADVARHFDRVHVLGHWERGVGIADLSTNPLIEGQPVVTRSNGGFVWHSVDFGGNRRDLYLAADEMAGAAA